MSICTRMVCLLACIFALAPAPGTAADAPRHADPDAYAAFCMGVNAMHREDWTGSVYWFEAALEHDPLAVDCHLWIAVICDERLHTAKKAAKHFDRALELSPDSFRVRYRFAQHLRRIGKRDESKKEMLLAIDTPEARANPALAAQAYQELAVSAEFDNDWQQAADYYEHAADNAASPVYPLLRLAHVCKAMGDNQRAVDALLRMQQFVPSYAEVHRELADTYEAMGKWTEALAELDNYMTHRNGPHEQPALLGEAAELAEKAGLPDTALAYRQRRLLKLIDRQPASGTSPELCEKIAATLQQLGHPEQAEPYLERALEAADDDSRTRIRARLAVLHQRLGQFDKAIDELTQCIQELEPNASVPYRAELCAALESAGRFDEAEAALRAIIDIPGFKAEGHAELGLFHKRRGNVDRAIEQLRDAISLADTNESIRHRVNLAAIYSDAGRYDDAELLLLESKRMFPDDPSVNNALGWLYAERGRNLDEALTLIRDALKAEPRNPYFLDSLGWVYFKQGRNEEALKELLDAASLTQDSVISDHLGDVYMAIGQPDRAKHHWERSLALDPDSAGVRAKLEKLNSSP